MRSYPNLCQLVVTETQAHVFLANTPLPKLTSSFIWRHKSKIHAEHMETFYKTFDVLVIYYDGSIK